MVFLTFDVCTWEGDTEIAFAFYLLVCRTRTGDGCVFFLSHEPPTQSQDEKQTTGKYSATGYGIAHLCFDHEGEPKCGEDGTVPAKLECQNNKIKRCEGLCAVASLKRAVAACHTHRQLEVGARLGQRKKK